MKLVALVSLIFFAGIQVASADPIDISSSTKDVYLKCPKFITVALPMSFPTNSGRPYISTLGDNLPFEESGADKWPKPGDARLPLVAVTMEKTAATFSGLPVWELKCSFGFGPGQTNVSRPIILSNVTRSIATNGKCLVGGNGVTSDDYDALCRVAPSLNLGKDQVVQMSKIQVLSGTYGGNCGQPQGNVTADLANKCNGKSSCEYSVDYQVIGDPAPGCAKDYVAKWKCTSGGEKVAEAAAEAGYGSVVQLSCP